MNIDTEKLLNEPITLLCCIKAKDAGAAQDQYHVCHVIGTWDETTTEGIDGTGNVSIGKSVKIQVPRANNEYLPYAEYVSKASQSENMGVYTVTPNDIAIRGFQSLKTPLTRSEALEAAKGKPSANVRHFRDLVDEEAINWQALTGVNKFASVVYIEGV